MFSKTVIKIETSTEFYARKENPYEAWIKMENTKTEEAKFIFCGYCDYTWQSDNMIDSELSPVQKALTLAGVDFEVKHLGVI